ncbi:MAG: hypothetical protein WCI29_13670 [Actinomycetes bacterium]
MSQQFSSALLETPSTVVGFDISAAPDRNLVANPQIVIAMNGLASVATWVF